MKRNMSPITAAAFYARLAYKSMSVKHSFRRKFKEQNQETDFDKGNLSTQTNCMNPNLI